MTSEWFAQYMHHVAANVKERDGSIRFTYKQLRTALNAMESGDDSHVPEPVLRLFANIVGVLPPVELTQSQEAVLFLALLNCHMAYHLCSGNLLHRDKLE